MQPQKDVIAPLQEATPTDSQQVVHGIKEGTLEFTKMVEATISNMDNPIVVGTKLEVSDVAATHQICGLSIIPPPNENCLEFWNMEADLLLDSWIVFNWEEEGWCLGQIKKRNLDRRLKLDGEHVTFFVYYETDGDWAQHALKLENYATNESSPMNSWALVHV